MSAYCLCQSTHAADGSPPERQTATEETAARRVGGLSGFGVDVLGKFVRGGVVIALVHVMIAVVDIGSFADKPEKIDVEGDALGQTKLETDAELAAEVLVVGGVAGAVAVGRKQRAGFVLSLIHI